MHWFPVDSSYDKWSLDTILQNMQRTDIELPSISLIIHSYGKSISQKLESKRKMVYLPDLQIAPGVKAINQSQFVDDTLLLGVTSPIIARMFKRVFDNFLTTS